MSRIHIIVNKFLYLDDKDVFAEMPIDTGIEPNFIGTKVVVPEEKEIEKGQFHIYNMVAGTDLVLNSFKTGCE